MIEKTKSRLKNLSLRSVISLAVIVVLSITSINFIVPQRAHAALSPTLMQCLAYQPPLYQGVQNQRGCVFALQGFLRNQGGFYIIIDGYFGPQTKGAVVQLQRAAGFTAREQDGIVGPKTWQVIRYICTATYGRHCNTVYVY